MPILTYSTFRCFCDGQTQVCSIALSLPSRCWLVLSTFRLCFSSTYPTAPPRTSPSTPSSLSTFSSHSCRIPLSWALHVDMAVVQLSRSLWSGGHNLKCCCWWRNRLEKKSSGFLFRWEMTMVRWRWEWCWVYRVRGRTFFGKGKYWWAGEGEWSFWGRI